MEQPLGMLPNGMPNNLNNMNSMQRTQAGNPQQQVYAVIVNELRKTMPNLPQGWQTTFDLRDRAAKVMQLVTQLRMLQHDPKRCLAIALSFENQLIQGSTSKDEYNQGMERKLEDIAQRRAAQAPPALPMGMSTDQNNMGNMGGMQNTGMNGITGMNMNFNPNAPPGHIMGIQNGQLVGNPGPANQNFPTQLQRPMQPSPLPPQQQQPPPTTMDPAALHNPQMQTPMTSRNQPNQQPNHANMDHQAQAQQWEPPLNVVMARAQQLFNAMTKQQQDEQREKFLSSVPPHIRVQFEEANVDPLMRMKMKQAKEQLIQHRAMKMGLAPPQNGNMQMGNNVGMQGNSMQQIPASQPGASNVDFSSLLGQQANAIRAQESGDQVVPASNNNNGMNGGMNMQQGVNPQMLGNPNGQAGNNPQFQMQQYLAMERQKAMRQNNMAQQQAMAQQNQLRGQPGGLNTPNAQGAQNVNSPAMNMSMLNRPMVPPGQATPSTPQPQQNRQQGMPQTPANPTTQLQMHHQAMLDRNNQQMNQEPPSAMQLQQMYNTLPANVQQRLSGMPQPQARELIGRFIAQQQQQQNNAGMMGNQPIGGPNMAQNLGMMSNQQGMPGLPQNMGNNAPTMNLQHHMNQLLTQPGQDAQVTSQQELHKRQLQQKAMDLRPFPRSLLQNLQLSLPEHIVTWAQLRQHILQNQAVIPSNSLQKLQQAQRQYFETHPEQVMEGMKELQQRMRGAGEAQAMQNGAPRPQSTMPGQAPPAQMVPPAAPMQRNANQDMFGVGQFMNQNTGRPRMPTNEEIQLFKQKYPAGHVMTDDDARRMMIQLQMSSATAPSAEMQQNMRNQAMMLTAQQQAPANKAQNGNVQQANQPKQPQQANRQGQPQAQKRAQGASDDVVEIPNPNAQQARAPQAPPMQSMPQQQQPHSGMPRIPSQAELDKMSPQARMVVQQKMKQMEALRNAQLGISSNQNVATGQQPQQVAQSAQPLQQQQQPAQANVAALNQAEAQRKFNVWMQEVSQANPKGRPVQVDAKGLEQAQASLKKLYMVQNTIEQAIKVAVRIPHYPEAKIKEAMRIRMVISQNCADANGNIKGHLSVSPAELHKIEQFIGRFVGEVKAFNDKNAAVAGQVQPNATAQTASAKPTQPPPMERKASHVKKASASSKAPPAPTENKTFDWGAASPHGVPKYDTARKELTSENLKLPPKKKVKTGQAGSQDSTPAGQAATPGTNNASPIASVKMEQAKKMPPQLQKPAAAETFKCDDPLCDASFTGFETQAELEKHKQASHQPIEDPLNFLLQSAAKACGVDQDGKPLPAKAPVQTRRKLVPNTKRSPKLKQESPTKSATTGSGAKPAVTPAESSNVGTKAPDSAVEIPEKLRTLMEAMCDNVGYQLPASGNEKAAEFPEFTMDASDSSFADLFQSNFANNDDLLHDWSQFQGVNDWGLRPEPGLESSPLLTPSDGSSHSSHESDILQNERLRINFQWDAFGNGDTGVPEALMMQTFNLGEGEQHDKSGDVAMADGNGGDGQDAPATGYRWDWDASADLIDWDATFSAGNGMPEPIF